MSIEQKTNKMKASIVETFNGMMILADASDSEFSRFNSLSEIKKCENVLVEKQEPGCPFITAIIDDDLVKLVRSTFKHPHGGRETVFEVYY